MKVMNVPQPRSGIGHSVPLTARILSFAAAFGLFVASPCATADCTFGAPPAAFVSNATVLPGAGGATLQATSLAIYSGSSARRLLVQLNYGYAVFDLSTPERPVPISGLDIHAQSPPKYAVTGDGQYTVNSVVAAADGSRLVIGYNSQHGNI